MTQLLKPDICVIGAGSGGLSVAAAAASFGVSVVLVEQGRMGGDCLNYGCVPSKALIAAARQARAVRSGGLGVAAAEAEIDFKAVMRHVHSSIAAIAPNDSVERFTALGVKVIQATAQFVDRRTVAAGGFEIRARRFVIATGSSPLVPPIPGLDTVDYLTNETLFDLTRRPGHLVIVGGGPIGMEMAQAFRRLGSQVTVIEAMTPLGNEDPEIAALALASIRAEGVTIHSRASVASFERRGKTGVRVNVEAEGGRFAVDGTHLLLAVGRKANVDKLDLAKAGIAFDARGAKVGAKLRTSNRRVYAIGDAAGSLQFTHVANYHAGLVLRAMLFRLRIREDRSIIPRVTFTDPEIAHVGLNEDEARKAEGDIKVLRWPYAENDRAQAEGRTTGHIKLLTCRKGRILGASIVGSDAGEMINMWSLAMSKRMSVRDIVGYVAPYPTVSEIGKRAAITYFIGTTRKPLVRRLLRFLRFFG